MLCPAYIDAGTGSLVLQFLIGGLLGMMFILKVFWRSLVSRASRLFGKKGAETAASSESRTDSEE